MVIVGVSCRPAYTITTPFAVLPSRHTGATHCEQVAAVLTFGRMAVLCNGQVDEVTLAVADIVQSHLAMVRFHMCCGVLAGWHAVILHL